MTNENDVKRRRGILLYERNPYVKAASANTDGGFKRRTLQGKDGKSLMITDSDGKEVAPAGFWQTQEVDKTQFVKLYVNGVKVFRDMTSAGTKVFEVLYTEVQKSIGRDKVYLSFLGVPIEFQMSQATFTRGMKELIAKKFVAPTLETNWYWVNPDYMWNGDRLAYVKDYRLRRDEQSDKQGESQISDASQKVNGRPKEKNSESAVQIFDTETLQLPGL